MLPQANLTSILPNVQFEGPPRNSCDWELLAVPSPAGLAGHFRALVRLSVGWRRGSRASGNRGDVAIRSWATSFAVVRFLKPVPPLWDMCWLSPVQFLW